MDILYGLNPAQREAVEAIQGPVLILTEPGAARPGFSTRILKMI
jgi:superfamily I DNA/RNA helicase